MSQNKLIRALALEQLTLRQWLASGNLSDDKVITYLAVLEEVEYLIGFIEDEPRGKSKK